MIEIKAQTIVISDACREAHGDVDAVNEAVRHLRDELDRLLTQWPAEAETEFRITLTVKRHLTPIDEAGP